MHSEKVSALGVQVGGSHYKDAAIQPVQYIEANNLPFLEGCVVKRVTRHAKPTGKGRQDIEKAIHELQLLLELRYPVAVPEPVNSTPDGDGWISWGGGKCPVPIKCRVSWKIRAQIGNGGEYSSTEAGDLSWTHFGNGSDLIAYRLA